MQKTFQILFLCGVLSFNKEMFCMKNNDINYEEEIKILELYINNINSYLKNIIHYTQNSEKAKLIKKKVAFEKSLNTLLQKKEEEMNIQKLIHDAQQGIYSVNKHSYHMQWKKNP